MGDPDGSIVGVPGAVGGVFSLIESSHVDLALSSIGWCE